MLDTLPPEGARASLRDLVRLNRDFGGHSALRHAFRRVDPPAVFTALDIGAASGDMGAKVREWYPRARVVSLDYMEAHLACAEGPRVAGDAFRLPFGDDAVDYVYSSLFLHHFGNGEVVRLLGEMRRVARRAVLAVDLQRHPISYWFLPATGWLFGWDAVTLNDGPLSVAAGFTPGELGALASEAGLTQVQARTHGLSYRISLTARVGGA